MALDRPDIDVLAVINRMKEALGKSTDTDLAKILNVSNKTVSSWKNRNSIPMDVVVSAAFASGKSVENILFGREIKISENDLRDLDDVVMNIVGEKILKSVLGEFADEKLAFMEEDETWKKGVQIGALAMLLYSHLRKAKKMLVDDGGLSIEKFIEFGRYGDDIGSDAINLRKRLRGEVEGKSTDT